MVRQSHHGYCCGLLQHQNYSDVPPAQHHAGIFVQYRTSSVFSDIFPHWWSCRYWCSEYSFAPNVNIFVLEFDDFLLFCGRGSNSGREYDYRSAESHQLKIKAQATETATHEDQVRRDRDDESWAKIIRSCWRYDKREKRKWRLCICWGWEQERNRSCHLIRQKTTLGNNLII